MLNVLKSSTILKQFGNTKCAEVYCQTLDNFSIVCTFCELKSFDFADFLRHFKNVHFDNNASTLAELETTSIVTPIEAFRDNFDFAEQLQDVEKLTTQPDLTSIVLNKRETSPTATVSDLKEDIDDSYEPNTGTDISSYESDDNCVPKVLRTPKAERNATEFKCNECDNTYKISKNLERHILRCHSDNNSFNCPRCTFTTAHERALSKHVQRAHAGFPCNQCDKTYKSKEALYHHKFNHSGVRSFVCDAKNCDKAFFNSKNLASHKRIVHSLQPNYVCEMCGYRTKSKSALVVHKRSHTGEKPFACAVCDRRFASQSLLCEHKAMHLTDRPHKCEVCGATFARAKALYHHKHLHLGIKKFLCKICGRAYAQAAGLAGHMRNHKSEKL